MPWLSEILVPCLPQLLGIRSQQSGFHYSFHFRANQRNAKLFFVSSTTTTLSTTTVCFQSSTALSTCSRKKKRRALNTDSVPAPIDFSAVSRAESEEKERYTHYSLKRTGTFFWSSFVLDWGYFPIHYLIILTASFPSSQELESTKDSQAREGKFLLYWMTTTSTTTSYTATTTVYSLRCTPSAFVFSSCGWSSQNTFNLIFGVFPARVP